MSQRSGAQPANTRSEQGSSAAFFGGVLVTSAIDYTNIPFVCEQTATRRLGPVIDELIHIFRTVGLTQHNYELGHKAAYARSLLCTRYPSALDSAQRAYYAGCQECLDPRSEISTRRAVDNIILGHALINGLRITGEKFQICAELKNPDERMPEATWSISVIVDGKRAARIGLNLHRECCTTIVATISNIQGIDRDAVQQLQSPLGERTPWAILALSLLFNKLSPEINVLRGVGCRSHPARHREGFDRHRASNLYDRTFLALGMTPVRHEGTTEVRYFEKIR